MKTKKASSVDATPTGGPYFAHKLRKEFRAAGVDDRHLRIRVTRSSVILAGWVKDDASLDKVAAIVKRRSPAQVTLANHLNVGPPPRRR